MDTRIALIGIIVEEPSAADRINAVLHEYAPYIVGRMGIPYRQKEVCIISVVIDAPGDLISALSGTRSYKTAFSKDKICTIITEMKDAGLIDADIVELMISDYDEIMEETRIQCQPILDIYVLIQKDFDRISLAMTVDDIAGMKAVF